jgi:hypothetical protein
VSGPAGAQDEDFVAWSGEGAESQVQGVLGADTHLHVLGGDALGVLDGHAFAQVGEPGSRAVVVGPGVAGRSYGCLYDACRGGCLGFAGGDGDDVYPRGAQRRGAVGDLEDGVVGLSHGRPR